MKGFSVEVKLVEWKCNCKKHINGHCTDPTPSERTTHREAYLGNFGYKVNGLSAALRKWDRWLHGLNEISDAKEVKE